MQNATVQNDREHAALARFVLNQLGPKPPLCSCSAPCSALTMLPQHFAGEGEENDSLCSPAEPQIAFLLPQCPLR